MTVPLLAFRCLHQMPRHRREMPRPSSTARAATALRQPPRARPCASADRRSAAVPVAPSSGRARDAKSRKKSSSRAGPRPRARSGAISVMFSRDSLTAGASFPQTIVHGTRVAYRGGAERILIADVNLAHGDSVTSIPAAALPHDPAAVGSLKWLPITSTLVPPKRSTNAWRVGAPCGLSMSKLASRVGSIELDGMMHEIAGNHRLLPSGAYQHADVPGRVPRRRKQRYLVRQLVVGRDVVDQPRRDDRVHRVLQVLEVMVATGAPSDAPSDRTPPCRTDSAPAGMSAPSGHRPGACSSPRDQMQMRAEHGVDALRPGSPQPPDP